MQIVEKLERLIRFHRQRVFEANGEAHTRAIYRLKRTVTFKRRAQGLRDMESYRQGLRYEGMGY